MCIKTVYLIRHGETKGNKEKRYIGSRTDEPLSEEGLRKLTKWKENNVKVYSSPMVRCLQTAKVLFETQNVIVKDGLKEIDFGDFEGGNYKELSGNPDYQKWIDSGGEMPFPNGESRIDFINRSYKAFLEIITQDNSERIAIVCHGGNIMSVMSRLTDLEYYDFQIGCAEGYKLHLGISETGEIDVISYLRIYCGIDT